jgi:hypothetical protein
VVELTNEERRHKPVRRTLRMRHNILTKSVLYGLIVIVASSSLTAAGLEAGLRIYHGKLLDFTSVTHGSTPGGIAQYDAFLGWVPRLGRFTFTTWSFSVDASGVRANGQPDPRGARRIVTVGDSFTFGDEVDDHETWPAQLEIILQEKVVNAGVFAYGIDQAYLRAVRLLDVYDPSVVVLAFISSNINRSELSYYQRRWKPYFAYGANGLEMNNVPVPHGHVASRPHPDLNRALGYSYLANAVLTRTPLRSWYSGPHQLRVHSDGERVTIELLTRLSELGRRRNVQVVVATLATDGRIGGNTKLPGLVTRLQQNGIHVADLASEMLAMPRAEFIQLFRSKGHYGPEMNRWVARRLAIVVERMVRRPEVDIPPGRDLHDRR